MDRLTIAGLVGRVRDLPDRRQVRLRRTRRAQLGEDQHQHPADREAARDLKA